MWAKRIIASRNCLRCPFDKLSRFAGTGKDLFDITSNIFSKSSLASESAQTNLPQELSPHTPIYSTRSNFLATSWNEVPSISLSVTVTTEISNPILLQRLSNFCFDRIFVSIVILIIANKYSSLTLGLFSPVEWAGSQPGRHPVDYPCVSYFHSGWASEPIGDKLHHPTTETIYTRVRGLLQQFCAIASSLIRSICFCSI